jgi:hypothetical protein
MTLPTDENFTNRELSIEELEAIAAGGFWGSIESAFNATLNYIEGPGLKLAEEIGKAIFGKPVVVYGTPHKNR